MQLSLNWLNDYIDLKDMTPDAIAKTLTDIGHEVESIAQKSAFSDDVVAGKVLTAVPHPNADSLRCCTVDIGDSEPLAIVCGAPNARAGIFVAVAKVGATLPGDFKIKKSKIRGELSCGMLCSGQELGISDDHDGIIELKGTPTLGTGVGQLLGLSDTVIDVSITPNRGDCLSYLGIARDLSAKLKRTLRPPEVKGLSTPGVSSSAKVKVKLETDQCCRFVALYVKDVRPVPSPAWLQKRLTAAGMRPINLIVDATNYVMLELGQPIHAYDERDVRGGVISVRAAQDGETLVTLDGQTRKLLAGDLLICDAQGPIGLAGVMGGQSSEVKDDTTAVIIEVAAFSPIAVRKTARRLGLHSEASHRFERGINIDNLTVVAHRVAEVMALAAEHEKGLAPKIAHDHIDEYPGEPHKKVIALRLSRTREILGTPHLLGTEIVDILTGLEFEKLDSNEDRYVFEIPTWRNDIEREVDLIEEVARIKGYDKITAGLPVMSIKGVPEDPLIDFTDDTRVIMANGGFNETITFPFLAAKELTALGIDAQHPLYPTLSLANPLSEEHSLMQTTLIPGLLRAVQGNRRQGVHGVRLFECGRGYFNGGVVAIDESRFPNLKTLARHGRHLTRRAKAEEKRPYERNILAAILDQPFAAKSWNSAETAAGFFHGKAVVQGLLNGMGISNVQFKNISAVEWPFLHPGASALVIVNGKWAGVVGELHPQTTSTLDLSSGSQAGGPVILELDLEVVFNARATNRNFEPLQNRFPPVSRDLALQVSKEKTHQDVVEAIRGFKRKKFLSRYTLFDVYEGDKLPAGTKSMAYSFQFQSAEKTLSDKEVEPEITALVEWLREKLGATQR